MLVQNPEQNDGTKKGRSAKMMKLAVCDDEPYMLDHLSERLTEYMGAKGIPCRIYRFTESRTLLQNGGTFDLLFLDIRMKAPDGLQTAKLLRKRGFCGLLIFITVLKECVFDAFEAQPYDYLLKPLEQDLFLRTMDRALATLGQKSRQGILIRQGSSYRVIPLDEITYCEVIGHKIYLHTVSGQIFDYYGKMEALEQDVDRRFFRCHRSYLVNLDCVRGCKDGLVNLSAGGPIPVSRLRGQQLTQALLAHMKERRR